MNRKSVRAPLKSVILYELSGKVYRGETYNISQHGILMEYDSSNADKSFPSMFGLSCYPDFTKMNLEEIKALGKENKSMDFFIDKKVIRINLKPVRLFNKISLNNVEKKLAGCVFIDASNKIKMEISRYISLFTKNMIFLLNLFEGKNSKNNIEALQALAFFLGHDKNQKTNTLRQKILHDYQSLENI
ncbi:MAG: PilZ domain-containing protein [Halobacteriovoraceae bacterium]|nr:PilZ domain-containing protein [Halobacteriovoraceae bacterium]